MPVNEPSHDPGARVSPEAANLGLMRPPLIYLAALGSGLLLHFARPVGLIPRIIGLPLGLVAVVAAGALFIGATRTFRSAGTPVPGNRPTTVVVRAGPYRWSRNPIYLSFSLLQVGIACGLGSLWLLVSLVPAVALMSQVVIPREERYLEIHFPSDYPAYKASVRRWF